MFTINYKEKRCRLSILKEKKNEYFDLNIFFDESGKRANRPNLMGGLSIPSPLYNSDKFQTWCQKLRDNEVKFHWVGFTGDFRIKTNIADVMQLLSSHGSMLKFNVINYDYSILSTSTSSRKDISQVVYSKFPERLIYGLLRGYAKNLSIDANIFIEEATEYRDIKLHETIKEQLNVQSIYRGEQFKIIGSCLLPKGQEIGLELTDLLLGFVRTIILNENDTKSKSVAAKNTLIIELLKNPDFFSFLSNIRLFEWTRTRELNETDFNNYLQIYLSTHHSKYV
ncbi:hypothetical protein [Paenibacillus medicaginis]|uniref:DUF3800 domain-containing protein n=1 Tax=Paenibacillus medicaginis TaxID=1470560 RepID=A0ABV5CA61_9BACL